MAFKIGDYVLVCDYHRGVYAGYLEQELDGGKTVVLRDMRHCYYYAENPGTAKGTYSLASHGPAAGSKLGPKVLAKIYHVANLTMVTEEAKQKFEQTHWS